MISSMVIFSSNIASISKRPLTQHGLLMGGGLQTARASSSVMMMTARTVDTSSASGTAAVGNWQQIKNKRYWQAQLQQKMNEIQRETESLAVERDAMQREHSSKSSFERRVQDAAKKLTGIINQLPPCVLHLANLFLM